MRFRTFFFLILLAGWGVPAAGQATPFLSSAPEHPDPELRYVIYLHGQIIENGDRRPVHPRFGVYEYDEVLRTLSVPGVQVISEQRQPNADVSEATKHVVQQVRRLLGEGVDPSHITVVGFSKGGRIAIMVSSALREPISYVLLAACNQGVFRQDALKLTGRVLSIYEESDGIGRSCAPLFQRSPDMLEAREVKISTGAQHGAFYRPRSEWVTETLSWILDDSPDGASQDTKGPGRRR